MRQNGKPREGRSMALTGKIWKGIGGFYYVHTAEGEFECRAKGIFRNRKEKPLVGDNVVIEPVIDSEKPNEGSVIKLLPRKNQLVRPEAANIDQAVVVFALRHPDPNLSLLDRFLINMEKEEIPVVIFFNKTDLVMPSPAAEAPETEVVMEMEKTENGRMVPAIYSGHPERIPDMYRAAGYRVLEISTVRDPEENLREIMTVLCGKTTVLSGPSGVGKSSITNLIHPEADMETGELSKKIERGKNTTRHTELFCLSDDTYVLDTPGFTSLYVKDVLPERLMYYYPEFEAFRTSCRFNTCLHLSEKDCAVKKAVEEGRIARERYESYKMLYEELKNQKRY